MKTYDVEEAGKYCKCHPETIRDHIRKGRLVASKPGRKYCITQSALDAFLNEQENDQLQASLKKRSEDKCRSYYEKVYTTSISEQKAVNELDKLLEPQTR